MLDDRHRRGGGDYRQTQGSHSLQDPRQHTDLPYDEETDAGRTSGALVAMPLSEPPSEKTSPVVVAHDVAWTDAGDGDEREGSAISLHVLFRAKWLILGVFVFLCLATIPPIWSLVVPRFSALATVRVRPTRPELITKNIDGTENRNFGAYLNTLIAGFTNPTILQRVLEREDVRQSAWSTCQPRTLRTMLGSSPPSPISRLKSAITAENRPNTELIDVEVETEHGKDAQVIVNALVEEFMKHLDESAQEMDTQLFDALHAQKVSLEGVISELVGELGDLSKQLGTDDPDIVRAHLAAQLIELEMERSRLQRDYEMTVWELETRESDEPVSPSATDATFRYAQDREWVRLNNQLSDAQHALDMAQARYGEAHPVLKERRSDVDHAQRLIEQREMQLGSAWNAPDDVELPGGEATILFLDKRTLQRLSAKGKRELELLDGQIAELKREQEAKGDLAKLVAGFNDRLRRKQGAYEKIVGKIQAMEIERGAPGRITVSAWALEPTEPARDRRILYTGAALVFALMSGVMLAHLRTTLDPKVHEAVELQQAMRIPFLGQIPAVPDNKSLAPTYNPLVTECTRIIRTALLEQLCGSGHRVILITSATSSAGKTSVAIELSRSLASLGKRTLLVEADLRRPTLSKRLGIETKIGLAALLTGSANQKHVVTPTDNPNLDVVLAGERPKDFDPELLADGVFATCLAKWRKAYDFVLVDSPPILPVADARILAGHVDGSIMVSRSSHCKRADVIQACADLTAAGSPLLGTVLVGVRSGPAYGYSYDYDTR